MVPVLYHLNLIYPWLSNYYQHIKLFTIKKVDCLINKTFSPKYSDEYKFVDFLLKTGHFYKCDVDVFRIGESLHSIYKFSHSKVRVGFVDNEFRDLDISHCKLFYKSMHPVMDIFVKSLPITEYSRIHSHTFIELDKTNSILLSDDFSEWFPEINTEIWFQKWLTSNDVLYIVDKQKTKWFKGK